MPQVQSGLCQPGDNLQEFSFGHAALAFALDDGAVVQPFA